jgi:phospholipid/cholesterol/gamma-HCH transport system substrate-binding protein
MSSTVRLGVFIVGTLAMFATGVFLIGERQLLFSSTDRVTTSFATVTGLSEGAEVRIGGVQKGIVKDIQLPADPDGSVTVVMALDRATRGVVRSDSIATIGTEGLLGNKFVEISFGSDGAPPIPPGGGIGSKPPVDMSDLVAKTNDILATAAEITTKINHGQGTVGALVNDRGVYERLDNATAAFSEDMEALKHNFFLRGFFSKRGYEDSSQLNDHLVAQLPREPPRETFHYDVKKVFTDAEHAKLKNEDAMDEAGRFLERYPFGVAVVVASGGMKGDSTEMHTLLRARAMVVRDYLVKHFKMDDTRVRTLDAGKSAGVGDSPGAIDIVVYPPAVRAK